MSNFRYEFSRFGKKKDKERLILRTDVGSLFI